MEAIIVIAVTILFAFVLKALDYFSNRRNLKSVGAKSNAMSRNIPKVDITNPEELKNALDYYTDFPD